MRHTIPLNGEALFLKSAKALNADSFGDMHVVKMCKHLYWKLNLENILSLAMQNRCAKMIGMDPDISSTSPLCIRNLLHNVSRSIS